MKKRIKLHGILNYNWTRRRRKKSTSRKENKHFVLRGPGKTHFISSWNARKTKRLILMYAQKLKSVKTRHIGNSDRGKEKQKLYFSENNIRFQAEKSDRVSIDFLSSYCHWCWLCPGSVSRVYLQGAWCKKCSEIKKFSFVFCLLSFMGNEVSCEVRIVVALVVEQMHFCHLFQLDWTRDTLRIVSLNLQCLIKKPWICFPWILEKVLVSVYGFNFRCFIRVRNSLSYKVWWETCREFEQFEMNKVVIWIKGFITVDEIGFRVECGSNLWPFLRIWYTNLRNA